MSHEPKLLKQRPFYKCPSFNISASMFASIYICTWTCVRVHRHLCTCTCVCVCVCVCAPVFVSLAPRSPTESDLFWIPMPVLVEAFLSLLKVSAEAVKRYRSEHITFPKGLLGGSHFMCQTPSFQDRYLTCFVTWLNLHVFPSGLLLSEALCCEMKITGICLPNAVIQRIVN